MLKLLLVLVGSLLGGDAWAATDTFTPTATATVTTTATRTPTAAPTHTPQPGRHIGSGTALVGVDVLVVPASVTRRQIVIVADGSYALRNVYGQPVGFPFGANQPYNATLPESRNAVWIRALSSSCNFYWWEWQQ